MMITEEFSFPIITATGNNTNVVHLTVLPTLWTAATATATATANRSSFLSSAEHDLTAKRKSKLFTRSFSQVESQVLFMKPSSPQSQFQSPEAQDADEEKMDMLWEDFNNNELPDRRLRVLDAPPSPAPAPSFSSDSSSSISCSSPLKLVMENGRERVISCGSSFSSLSSPEPRHQIITASNNPHIMPEFEATEGGSTAAVQIIQKIAAAAAGGGT